MRLTIGKTAHLDHRLPEWAMDRIMAHAAQVPDDGRPVILATLELTNEAVPCGLYGPIMGDDPIKDREVVWMVRGARTYKSRIKIDAPMRYVPQLSWIAGRESDGTYTLWTAFGGPIAPREPMDPSLQGLLNATPNESAEERRESEAFWAEHALSHPDLVCSWCDNDGLPCDECGGGAWHDDSVENFNELI